MSYGPDFLSKEKDKRRTIKAKKQRGREVEEEGIVTSRLPAYTDILKIRFEIIYGFIVTRYIINHFPQENVRLQNTKGTRLQL